MTPSMNPSVLTRQNNLNIHSFLIGEQAAEAVIAMPDATTEEREALGRPTAAAAAAASASARAAEAAEAAAFARAAADAASVRAAAAEVALLRAVAAEVAALVRSAAAAADAAAFVRSVAAETGRADAARAAAAFARSVAAETGRAAVAAEAVAVVRAEEEREALGRPTAAAEEAAFARAEESERAAAVFGGLWVFPPEVLRREEELTEEEQTVILTNVMPSIQKFLSTASEKNKELAQMLGSDFLQFTAIKLIISIILNEKNIPPFKDNQIKSQIKNVINTISKETCSQIDKALDACIQLDNNEAMNLFTKLEELMSSSAFESTDCVYQALNTCRELSLLVIKDPIFQKALQEALSNIEERVG